MATFSINVDVSELEELIKDLESRRAWMQEKADEFIHRLAEIGVQVARTEYAEAPYAGDNDVVVNFTDEGQGQITITASGKATLFIEFGTGVLNPEDWQARSELVSGDVALHGEYGRGNAKSPFGWIYMGDMPANPPAGTNPSYIKKGFIHTYGEAPHAAMYHARKEMIENIERIAREVFSL